MVRRRVAIIGAGIGGLTAALDLARQGLDVTVIERAGAPGGKMRVIDVDGGLVDSGPTVLTMRWVFDELFADAGASLKDRVALRQLDTLARHAWSDSERLDLFADEARSADAIGQFAGASEARGFREFCVRARSVYQTLEGPFIRSEQPTPVSLALGAGLKGIGDLWRISPFQTLWKALGDHFRDPRLRQLFGRYATYCGSSPFDAPATLMLVAHVEQQGVWTVQGGMHALARALADTAIAHGATLRYDCHATNVITASGGAAGVQLSGGETIPADAVIVNADAAAVAEGLLGGGIAPAVTRVGRSARSLSAVTWSLNAAASGFPLTRHNVFFSRDYAAEFDDIFERGRLPGGPTVYVCAQDRDDDSEAPSGGERLLVLVNAPAIGDVRRFERGELNACEDRTFSFLERCGLVITRTPSRIMTTPNEFAQLFPGSGGALYGPASHGWMASFSRPAGRTRIPGLYLAGGSVHPGPGVPMAALSGRIAARALMADLASTSR